MKILLIGKGHLGTYLKNHWNLPENLHWKEDMEGLTSKTLEAIRPDIVINTAAKTDMVWCEANKDECFLNNTYKPANLFSRIQTTLRKTAYIHISSGCVWEGPYNKQGKPFAPDYEVNPACVYTESKVSCDNLLQSYCTMTPLTILRPRLVYSSGNNDRSVLAKINRYPKLIDTHNSISSVRTIAKTIDRLIETNLIFKFYGNIMNVYDKGIITPYQIGLMLHKYGCRGYPEKIEKKDLNSWHRPKRVDTVLHDKAFELLVQPPNVEDELEHNINLFAKNLRMESLQKLAEQAQELNMGYQ